MRSEFVEELKLLMTEDRDIFVLLGDLGFGIFDELRKEFPDRCLNVGSAEQLMLGMACGMTLQGKTVICYSITSFLIYRPFEFIRNYLNHEQIPVKLVGSGRDSDYIEAGFTHHSSEVSSILSELKNIKLFFPENTGELRNLVREFVYFDSPAFLSLRR